MSQRPFAILPMVLADAGAIKSRSAQRPSSTWLLHTPVSASKYSVYTGFYDSVAKVSGVIKFAASVVSTTLTVAPPFTNARTKGADLYAAILPQTPKMIFLPCNIDHKNNKVIRLTSRTFKKSNATKNTFSHSSMPMVLGVQLWLYLKGDLGNFNAP